MPAAVDLTGSHLQTRNEILIHAPAEVVFDLAADVLRWPELLDHYRYVRLIPDAGFPGARKVRMSAVRSGIPVSWTAVQRLDPTRNEIHFVHVAGATRGMDVEWRIEPADPGKLGVQVSIDHSLAGGHWWMRNPVARFIAGRVFISHIAEQTLRGIKRQAEAIPVAGAR